MQVCLLIVPQSCGCRPIILECEAVRHAHHGECVSCRIASWALLIAEQSACLGTNTRACLVTALQAMRGDEASRHVLPGAVFCQLLQLLFQAVSCR